MLTEYFLFCSLSIMARAYRSLDDYFARTGQAQKDLAEELGVTTATMSKWTAGLAFPQTPAMLLRLSEATGITVDALVRAAAAKGAA